MQQFKHTILSTDRGADIIPFQRKSVFISMSLLLLQLSTNYNLQSLIQSCHDAQAHFGSVPVKRHDRLFSDLLFRQTRQCSNNALILAGFIADHPLCWIRTIYHYG